MGTSTDQARHRGGDGTASVLDAVGRVERMRLTLATVEATSLDDASRLELLRSLEDLTRSAAALSVRCQVTFRDSQVAGQARAGVPAGRRGLAVADDLAAARKTSPYWGSRDLTSARALVAEMPRALAALETGTISAYQARTITEATTCLEPGDRAEVDERLAGSLAGASNAEIASAVRALVYEVDPAGFVARARKAAKDRGVSSRPAPDVMAVLSARLPAAQAATCYKALREHAVTAKASGDPRTLNQLMADALVERLTGRSVVDGIDVEVGLLITDEALFGGGSDAADLEGYGPIPAQTARDLLGGPAADGGASSDGDEADQGTDETDQGTDETDQGTDDGVASEHVGEPEVCPDGPRCVSWDCSLFHGFPQPGQSSQPTGATATASPTTPDTKAPAGGSCSAANTPGTSDPTADGDDSAGVRAAKVWLRRLYSDPVTGVLTVRDPRRRDFTGSLRSFLVARDRTCRNSWCGAPVRDVDHVLRRRDGGPATEDNGRGLCRRCNLARERDRFQDPPPESYRPPPPAMFTLTGRGPAPPAPGSEQPDAA
ncbi:HNH endonuclease [Ornithinimicrobium avium]|nr:DUF222 domain-containing protein [Ornithinimicrobium avium]